MRVEYKTGIIFRFKNRHVYKYYFTALLLAAAVFTAPFFGCGISEMRVKLILATDNGTVHNELLSYAMLFGIPGILFYFAFMLSIFIRGFRYRKELSDFNIIGLVVAFGYLVGAFFSYTIFYTTPFMCIFLGFGYYKKSSGNGEE